MGLAARRAVQFASDARRYCIRERLDQENSLVRAAKRRTHRLSRLGTPFGLALEQGMGKRRGLCSASAGLNTPRRAGPTLTR